MDIGAKEIWVDVGLENDSEPVRRFETFTADLNRMAEWLSDCGIKSVEVLAERLPNREATFDRPCVFIELRTPIKR